jgi:topoisomerase-4 subunit A
LMAHFGLTEIQADAILDLKLRHLAKLEEMEIRREQAELELQATKIRGYLNNPELLKGLIIEELQEDAKKHGDDRRSPIVQRSEAIELKESDLTPAEAITVVLSHSGWIRAAKGTDIDVHTLNYRAGDAYLSHSTGKSNQRVYLLDNTGRSYALSAATLPSARGQGEPVTTKLAPPAGSRFVEVIMGDDAQPILLASNQGYGFVSTLSALDSTVKAGKTLVTLTEGSEMMPVLPLPADADRIAVLSSSGRLLIYPLADLPVMNRGKGNKLIALESHETVRAMVGLVAGASLVIMSGSRPLTLKDSDVTHYSGKRGQRGHLLPRGYQKAESMQMTQ